MGFIGFSNANFFYKEKEEDEVCGLCKNCKLYEPKDTWCSKYEMYSDKDKTCKSYTPKEDGQH